MTVGTPVLIKHPDLDETVLGSYVASLQFADLIRLAETGAVVVVPKKMVHIAELGHKGRSWSGR